MVAGDAGSLVPAGRVFTPSMDREGEFFILC